MGGFMAEIPYGPDLNTWIVRKLVEKNKSRRPNYDLQYWLGATDINNQGDWVWEHRNTTVKWFDWADGEPNNYTNGEVSLYIFSSVIHVSIMSSMSLF